MKEAADLFKILSVDTRIKIVELLKKGPMTVNALAEALGVTQSAVSQHLRIMKSAGILNNKREGYWVRYGLNEEVLLECRDRMSQVCNCGCEDLCRLDYIVSELMSQECTCGCEGSLESLQRYRDALKGELEEVNKKIKDLK